MQVIVLEYTPYVYRGTGMDGRVWRSVVNAGVPVHEVHGFMYGEFVLGAVGVLDVLFYTTWNGRVTPQPLCGLGIKTYVDTLNPGCDAYRASTATALDYDFKSESATAPVVKMALPCSGKSYGLYNIWALPNMPDKGEVRAHISIQARP